jgi:hypothetical protein
MPFPSRSGVRAKRTISEQGSKMKARMPVQLFKLIPSVSPGVAGISSQSRIPPYGS